MKTDLAGHLIRKFVMERFPLARQRRIGDDDSFLESGIIDSLGILELVSFVEKEFEITVSDEELLPENFESFRCLIAFVERKRDGAR